MHPDDLSAANWEWMLSDGLGSVRGVVGSASAVLEHRHFDPFGNLYAGTLSETDFGFTGEPFDSTSGLLYLRARHYKPGIGAFVSRDPFEGMMDRPISRNGYSWMEGRVTDGRDPSGRQAARDCSEEAFSNCNLEGSECHAICLFADHWMNTAQKFNSPSITNMSNEAFAAMIAAKFIFEDATQFNSTEGLLNQALSGAGIDPVFRVIWETVGSRGEISYGPGNIPLSQAENAAGWWRKNASCLGFDRSIFNSGIYDTDIIQQCTPSMSSFPNCTIISTPHTRAIIEMNSFNGHTTWDEWLAVTMLQAAHRVRNYRSENDISNWGDPRIVDGVENQVSAYIIALGQVAWSNTDKAIYDLSEWTSPGGAYDWALAVTSVRDNTHHFWPELRSLFDGGYIEATNQERQRLQALGLT